MHSLMTAKPADGVSVGLTSKLEEGLDARKECRLMRHPTPSRKRRVTVFRP